MAQFPVVKGVRARFTKINSCGRPIAGPANRLVTSGFVSVNLSPVMKDAEDLEQINAEGRVCVYDRTPPERKYFNTEIELCNVNTELIAMLTGWEQVLDHDDKAIGFRDQQDVESDYGVALEVWTGGRADGDCPAPDEDSIFSTGGSGRHYGYFLLGGVEFTLGDISIEASVSTFTMSGITVAMPQWGRGPYNVAGTDAAGTPGRLLVPTSAKEHYTVFRTPVPPPEPTNGAVPLDITGKFVAPNYYYGGPSNAPAADTAPDQANPSKYSVTITGTPTGGDFTLKANGLASAPIAHDATAADVKSALAAIDDGLAAALWGATGGALPGAAVTVTPPVDVVVTLGVNSLTGGTTPTVVVAAV